MPPDQPPQGQRFSHVYINRGEPVQDSSRMRRRLASLIQNYNCAEHVERELGIPGPWTSGRSWYECLEMHLALGLRPWESLMCIRYFGAVEASGSASQRRCDAPTLQTYTASVRGGCATSSFPGS